MKQVLKQVRGQRDLWTGLIFLAFGGAGLAIGLGYPLGTAAKMGTGYFPVAVSASLVLVGAVTMGRGLLRTGEGVGQIAWVPLAKIALATALFAALLAPVGFLAAAATLLLVSASASKEFALGWRAATGLIVLVGLSALVFVRGLGLPMPLFGSWWQPVLPGWLVS